MHAENKLTHLDFRLAVAKGLLEGHVPQNDRRRVAPNRDLPLRLTEQPFSERIPKTTKSGGRLQCEVCRAKGIKSQTQTRCKICKTPLHLHQCFEDYHTKLHYNN